MVLNSQYFSNYIPNLSPRDLSIFDHVIMCVASQATLLYPHNIPIVFPCLLIYLDLPSGKQPHNNGKSPFLMGKSTINGNFQ